MDRAKEASVKANMHTMQTTVEAMSIDHMGRYPSSTANTNDISNELPGNFANPYNGDKGGDACDWGLATNEGNAGYDADGSTFAATSYTITGCGKDGSIIDDLTLTPGQ